MKILPYRVHLADTYIFGPSISFEEGLVRIGFCLIWNEIGIAVDKERVYGFGCHACSAIGYAGIDELPEGWIKGYRPDHTYYFLCQKCRESPFEISEDYVITEENRQKALDEIIGQLKGQGADESESDAVRRYGERLLDESDGWGRDELSASLAAYSEGWSDGREKG